MARNDKAQPTQMPVPDPALKRLEPLVGTWEMTGRTLDSKVDNISGRNTFEWLPGGFFLKQTIELNFMGFPIKSLELIGYDPSTGAFSSSVYSNMSGMALPYKWDVQGKALTISVEAYGLAAHFEGQWSADGNTFAGGWRPEPGTQNPANVAYDLVGKRSQG